MRLNFQILFYVGLSFLLMQCSPKNKSMSNTSDPESWRSTMPKAGPAPRIEMGKYETFTLDNGLKVVVVQNSKIPRVSFQLLVDAPPINQKEFAGYVDFAGQMLTRGTKNKTKAEIDEAVDFIGASLSSSGNGIFASCLSKHKNTLLQLMSEVLLEPAFREDEFEKARKQTISGLTASADNPDYIANTVGQMLRNGLDHPYGEVPTVNSISKITLDQVVNYYHDYWKPNISYLAIVGDISIAEAKKLSESYFGSWKKGEIPKSSVSMPPFPEFTTVDFVDKAGAVQSVVNITYPVDLQHHAEDRLAASLMNAIFGGVFSSRINLNLRERNAFTYGARSSLNADRYVGYFSAGASVGNDVTDKAIQELLNEIQLMRNQPVTNEEFRLAKNVLAGEFARSLERPQTIANFALNIIRYGLPQDYYDTYLERLDKVTVQEVQNAARKYLRPDNARIVVVGNKREVAPKLAKFAHNKQVDFYLIDGTKVEETSSKEPLPLNKPQEIIEFYLSSIGGKEAINKIKTLEMNGSTSTGGFNLNVKNVYMKPDKMAMSITMQGQEIQGVVVNGPKAKVVAMGQTQILTGDDARDYINSTKFIEEVYFFVDGYKLELVGTETVAGKRCYVIEVFDPLGFQSSHYYDIETGLKWRTIGTRKAGDQIMVQTTDLANYREVEGVKFPTESKISGGGMPMAITMVFNEIKVNPPIDVSVFDF